MLPRRRRRSYILQPPNLTNLSLNRSLHLRQEPEGR